MAAMVGYLTIKAFGHLKNKTYSNCWCLLYAGKNDFPPHLDVYADQTRIEPGLCKKSLDIVHAKWGKVETPDPAFCIIIKGKRYLFLTETEKDSNIWCQSLICLSPDLLKSRQDKDGMTAESEMIMQDNVVYASSDDVSLFEVVADENEGRCAEYGLKRLIKLSVDGTSIKLFNIGSSRPVIEWTHRDIRSYGSSNYSLNITAGKKSPTGEGVFKFNTSEGARIVQQIGICTNRLKNQELGEHSSTPSFTTKNKTSNDFDSQFKTQLSLTIASHPPPVDGGKKLLEPRKSASNKSSNESLSKKDMKKEAKEKAKLAKQQEKEKKKEREKQEKQEKEKQKKLEKIKKDKGKMKTPVPDDDSMDYYSEPFDSQVGQPDPVSEGDYAECGIETRSDARKCAADSKVYNEPWGAAWPVPLHTMSNDDDGLDDDLQGMYASPIKLNKEKKGNRNAPQIPEESYEDISPRNPPSIPPKLDALGEDDSNNNVYDHFAGVTPNSFETPENVYGMDSAVPLTSNYEQNSQADLYSECTYETVG